MAKKAANQLTPGTHIRVKPGTPAPEFPDVVMDGWTGAICESSGAKANPQYIIEWDADTVSRMPATYRQACETQGLLFTMACLKRDVFDVVM